MNKTTVNELEKLCDTALDCVRQVSRALAEADGEALLYAVCCDSVSQLEIIRDHLPKPEPDEPPLMRGDVSIDEAWLQRFGRKEGNNFYVLFKDHVHINAVRSARGWLVFVNNQIVITDGITTPTRDQVCDLFEMLNRELVDNLEAK